MKMIGTTLKFNRKPFKKITFNDSIGFILLIAYIIGFSIGIFLIINGNEMIFDFIKINFNSYIDFKSNSGFFSIFLYSFLMIFPYYFIAFIFGTCIIGNIILPGICTFLGIFYGTFISYIYNVYAISGIGFSLLLIAPCAVLYSALLIFTIRESICFSTMILKNSLPSGTSLNFSKDLKIYSIRYLIFLSFNILISLLDAIFSYIFIKFFNF